MKGHRPRLLMASYSLVSRFYVETIDRWTGHGADINATGQTAQAKHRSNGNAGGKKHIARQRRGAKSNVASTGGRGTDTLERRPAGGVVPLAGRANGNEYLLCR